MAARRMGRPPRGEMPEGERREKIMRVAGELFTQRGYAAVSIGDIAAAVGVSKAALYHHFPAKDELYTVMLCELLELISGYTRAIVEAPLPLRGRLERYAQETAAIPADADMDSMMRDVAQHLSAEQRGRIAAAHATLTSLAVDLMRDGVDHGELRGDPAVLAHAFTHLLLAFSGRVGREAGYRGQPEVITAVVELFLHGASAVARPEATSATSR